ncbi:helix-turn-helix transcriptional regulator [Pseudomonas plecoglossicida]|uniref:helix-turn-helix transcriptional regulator n=1 Tax=Pseudomonas plecoglossicida TaxID=70775 RepID=UPI003D21534F
MNSIQTQRRILRLTQVQAATGLGRTAIYDLISRGLFPKGKTITGLRAVGWDSRAVEAWVDQQLADQ